MGILRYLEVLVSCEYHHLERQNQSELSLLVLSVPCAVARGLPSLRFTRTKDLLTPLFFAREYIFGCTYICSRHASCTVYRAHVKSCAYLIVT
jgi:hypothetical protein